MKSPQFPPQRRNSEKLSPIANLETPPFGRARWQFREWHYDVPMRFLLVEDDPRIARFVAKGLREQAYAVDVVGSGEEALYQAAINTYDLAILDVMIPAPDGFAVCRELRKSGQRMPILMLTARDALEDRITGLDCGADDYLTKPVEFRELLARLRALLRRPGGLQPAEIVVADLVVDTAGQNVSRGAGRYLSLWSAAFSDPWCFLWSSPRRFTTTCSEEIRSVFRNSLLLVT
jgi:DNA-binding response OmpR family regulator